MKNKAIIVGMDNKFKDLFLNPPNVTYDNTWTQIPKFKEWYPIKPININL